MSRYIILFHFLLVSLSTASDYRRNELLSEITGTTYYLDASGGSDSNDGSGGAPWQTLSKALAEMVDGDGVILADGDYGILSDDNPTGRSGYRYIIAGLGDEVYFDGISVASSSLSSNYIKIHGVLVLPDAVDPASSGNPGADDPQYADSTLSTYAKTLGPVILTNARYVQVIDCNIKGRDRHLTLVGIDIDGCEEVLIEHCEIETLHRGASITNSSNITFRGNHIHDLSGSGIQNGDTLCSGLLYERNYIHDSGYTESEDYAPRAAGQEYHASGMSIRSSDVTIRENILHDGFTSSGVMLYDTGDGYDNILIENNIIYDTEQTNVLRIFRLGENVVVRNNLVASSYRDTADARFKMFSAFTLESIAETGTPSLTMYNNIFIGRIHIGAYAANVDEGNNFCWSFSSTSAWHAPGDGTAAASDTILHNSSGDDFSTVFESGCFVGPVTYEFGHGATIDWTYLATSPARFAGDVETQASASLGSLVNGFILSDGTTRSGQLHDGGPYQMTGQPSPLRTDSSGRMKLTHGAAGGMRLSFNGPIQVPSFVE
jgi:hypothetical protein